MSGNRDYFFCGIGGSGMLPLALILKARGFAVSGSDRALDQNRTPEKFAFLKDRGIALYPQDGCGIKSADTFVVTSTAVERTVPDVAAARRIGAMTMTRAELLSKLFNEAKTGIGIAGTSGKSTVTGMTGWILYAAGLSPTVMNGAVMKNFVTKTYPFASAVVGGTDIFVSEIDESDGSIARYVPKVAVLNNVAHDHKSMDELRDLFAGFLGRADRAVVNLDNAETAELASHLPDGRAFTFGIEAANVDLTAANIAPAPDGIAFTARLKGGAAARIALRVPGRHNVMNALAALGAALAAGVTLTDAAKALRGFSGIKRRLETVGTAGGVTVIDDFAHNPDKIAASLAALHEFPGRLLIMFQPHGFGPLKLMGDEFAACFAEKLAADDVLVMPDPVYFGGTVERTVGSADIAEQVAARGRNASYLGERTACADRLLALAKSGDRIVVMGARDDSLSVFAADLVKRLG